MATKWLKVAKSGTSPLQRFWKNSEFFKDTLRTKITLRNLLKEIVCENQNFRSDLTVLSENNLDDLLKAVYSKVFIDYLLSLDYLSSTQILSSRLPPAPVTFHVVHR